MNPEFQDCKKRKKIQEFSRGKALLSKELETAEHDLLSSKASFEAHNFKWATIQSYYSMFHSGRALLFLENLREKSHFCLIIALRSLYVDTKQLPYTLIESLQKAKILREQADYYDEWSESAAAILIQDAEAFIAISRKIISEKK